MEFKTSKKDTNKKMCPWNTDAPVGRWMDGQTDRQTDRQTV